MSNVYGRYKWTWDAGNHTITIKPFRRNPKGVTPRFGLGNATITINVETPPQKLTKKITGETTSKGILPRSPYKMRRWKALPSGMEDRTIILDGAKGYRRYIQFKEATKFAMKELANDVTIDENGYGQLNIYSTKRIEW
jgi:hypothetical protein